MCYLAVPDPTLTGQWLAFLTPLMLAILTMVNVYTSGRAAKAAKNAAAEVVTVATTVAKSTSDAEVDRKKILDLADKTHTLVNSQMGQQLRLHAVTARTLANLTKNPVHAAAADMADAKLQEYETKQAQVDAKEERAGDTLKITTAVDGVKDAVKAATKINLP